MANTTELNNLEKIERHIRALDWRIQDAKRRVQKAAEQMLWRANQAIEDAARMMADEPCSMSWVDFSEGDLREAREAKAELRKLYEEKQLVEYFIKD